MSVATVRALTERHGADPTPIWPDGFPEAFSFDGFPSFAAQFFYGLELLRTGDDLATITDDLAATLAAQNVRYAELTTTAFTHFMERPRPAGDVVRASTATGSTRDGGGRRSRRRDRMGDRHPTRPRDARSDGDDRVPRERLHPGRAGRDRARRVRGRLPGGAVRAALRAGAGDRAAVGPARRRDGGCRQRAPGGRAARRPYASATACAASRIAAWSNSIVERGIMLEVCPTSNVLLRVVDSIDDHPLPALRAAGVRVCLNTDDPGWFATDLVTRTDDRQRASRRDARRSPGDAARRRREHRSCRNRLVASCPERSPHYDVSRHTSASANGSAMSRTVPASPAISTYSWFRVCDTVPTFSPAGIVDADLGADVAARVEGEGDHVAVHRAHLAQLVERDPCLVVVRHDHDVGVDGGDRSAQRIRHLALAVEHALGRVVAGVEPLAGDPVVLGPVPRHDRLPHVVVGEVPVLVVGRVEVGEVDVTELGGDRCSVAEQRRTRSPSSNCGTSSRSGLNERGAHCLTYAICTPVVESTRSAASSRLVSRIGSSGVPAWSTAIASRMASIRSPLCGWKNRDSTQNVSVT